MCLNPKWIYKKGNYKKDNYRGNAGDFYEIGTYSKCGSCEICQAEKANNWVIRNYYESKGHEKKCFITLTYAENPYIIIKKDLQDFLKKLRRYLQYHGYKEKIRYFACMEYGEKNNRPHAHVIIYGWEDENAEYLDINKRCNIVYQSEIIQNCWGLGRTSYQKFDDKEAPYIALYETSKETFKRAYKMTREKLKKLEELYTYNKRIKGKRRKDLLNGLKEIRKKMDKEKAKYAVIREFNTWSIALGWKDFYEEYSKSSKYVFTEYLHESGEFVTPSPWVKKLANLGHVDAIEEMRKRENEIKQTATVEEEKRKNQVKVGERRKKEIEEWQTKKTKIEIL